MSPVLWIEKTRLHQCINIYIAEILVVVLKLVAYCGKFFFSK